MRRRRGRGDFHWVEAARWLLARTSVHATSAGVSSRNLLAWGDEGRAVHARVLSSWHPVLVPALFVVLGVGLGYGATWLAGLEEGHAHGASGLDPQAFLLAHAPHQLLVALPLALLAAILVRFEDPRHVYQAVAWAGLGIALVMVALAFAAPTL